MTEYNGGFKSYDDATTSQTFFRATPRQTKTVTVLSGQVLKKHSFLESNTAGKLIAHSGMNEKALITFIATGAAETTIIAGLTFTAGAGGATAADLVIAFSGLLAGDTAAVANSKNPNGSGTFTSGTLTGYNTIGSTTADSVVFISTTPNAGVTDLTVTGTGDAPTVTVTSVNAPMKPIAGVLLHDVDATSGDIDATAYTEASFMASALVWEADSDVDTIEKPDGTTVACTAYYTGATTDILKKKFVEGSKFENIGILKAGETY